MVISIPIKPHLYKYVQYHYPDVYRLTETTNFGAFMNSCLRFQRSHKQFDDKRKKIYTKRLPVEISDSRAFKENSFNVTSYTVVRINRYIEREMVRELKVEVMTRESGQTIKQTIQCFMDRLGITEDDFGWDSFFKKLQREKSDKPNFLN